MRVLLVSTYELGHQPLHVASPAAALERAGHRVSALDLSVEQWDPQLIDDADAVAVSVPMHTAMRLALEAAGLVREQRPGLPVCLYGLYAGTSHDTVVGTLADRVISGEYEPALLEWVGSLDGHGSTDGADAAAGRNSSEQIVHLGRGRFDVPARHLLPPLERYARLSDGDEERLVGYVEASHGCTFSCRHCPVPTVYGGRIRIVDIDTILADIDQL
ncbi:MAG: radical SAM protein, partial [Acidimicrobiia bacterium]